MDRHWGNHKVWKQAVPLASCLRDGMTNTRIHQNPMLHSTSTVKYPKFDMSQKLLESHLLHSGIIYRPTVPPTRIWGKIYPFAVNSDQILTLTLETLQIELFSVNCISFKISKYTKHVPWAKQLISFKQLILFPKWQILGPYFIALNSFCK